MSAAGNAKAKEDALASGAKPRTEGRVREQGWRPTNAGLGCAKGGAEAARRRAIERRPTTARIAFRQLSGGRQ